jgi:hypothetical protein
VLHCIIPFLLCSAPTVFWQAFKFIKPILAGNTLKKIHIYDSDSKKYQAAFMEKMPMDSIPVLFGGSGQAIDLHDQ